MQFDELLTPVSANISPALGLFSELVSSEANPSILVHPDPLMNLVRMSHLRAVSRTTHNLESIFAPSLPPTVAPDAIQSQAIMAAIVDDDNFAAPDATDMDATLLPSIMQLVMYFCKRAAMEHLACRLGSVPLTGGEECKLTFEPGVKKACNIYLTQLAQNIMALMPFRLDSSQQPPTSSPAAPSPSSNFYSSTYDDDIIVQDMETHLKMCRDEVARFVSSSASKSGSNDSTINPDTSPLNLFAANTSQAAALFGAVLEPSVSDIIYYCFLPWFKLVFLSTFVFQQKPLRFADVWIAQYIIYIFGYLFAQDLATTPGLTAAQQAPLLNLKHGIATHMGLMARVQDRLRDMYVQTMQTVQANMVQSRALFAKGDQFEMRRHNMEAMIANYQSKKKDAQMARWYFIGSIVVYALTTVTVTFLLVYKRDWAPYALLLSTLAMLGIFIYALVLRIRALQSHR